MRIVDKAAARAPGESRALGVQARTVEVLERLGVVPEVMAAGRPIGGFTYHVGRAPVLTLAIDGIDAPYPHIWLLPQGRLEEILIARLAECGVPVERGAEVVGIEQTDGGVRARLGDGSELSAAYLIAADGGRSGVRRMVGADFDGESFDGTIHLLDSHLVWRDRPPRDDRGNFYVGRDTVLGLGRIEGSLWRVIAYLRPDDERVRGALSAEGMQSVLDEHAHLGASVADVAWQSVYRVSNRMVSRLRHGRVFLVGDAAHIHSPMGGQGLNTGVQDAHNLAWKLAAVISGAPANILDSYDAERLEVIRSVVRETAIGHRAISERSLVLARPVPAALARVGGSLLQRVLDSPAVHRRVAEGVAQLSIGYRGSPIVVDAPRTGGRLRAGDRAPDSTVWDAAGRLVRLHAVCAADTAHHLLAFAGRRATDADLVRLGAQLDVLGARHPGIVVHRVLPRGPGYADVPARTGDLHDVAGEAHRRHLLDAGGQHLVRPDGYLALRAEGGVDRLRIDMPWIVRYSTTAVGGSVGTSAGHPPRE